MNCVKNMLISAAHHNTKWMDMFTQYPQELTERAEKLLEFVGLYGKRFLISGDLSFGQQKLLEFAMALMNEPKVLLLDEPYEGLAPVIVDEIEKTLRVIKEQGMTTILVEQNAVRALELADRAVILDTGNIVFDGSAAEVLENAELRAEYLAI